MTWLNQFPGLVKSSKFNQIRYPHWLKKKFTRSPVVGCEPTIVKEKMSERQTKAGNQITLSLSLTLTLSHTHSISHSITLDMLNNFCFHVYAQKSLSHSFAFTTFATFTTFTTFNLSFNHSRHAEQLLFSCLCSKVTVYSRKLQWNFLGHPHPHHPLLWV